MTARERASLMRNWVRTLGEGLLRLGRGDGDVPAGIAQ